MTLNRLDVPEGQLGVHIELDRLLGSDDPLMKLIFPTDTCVILDNATLPIGPVDPSELINDKVALLEPWLRISWANIDPRDIEEIHFGLFDNVFDILDEHLLRNLIGVNNENKIPRTLGRVVISMT